MRDIRYRTALELIYSCGLRETEALHLTVHDINRAQGLLIIHGKGPKIAWFRFLTSCLKTHHSLEITSASGTAVPRLRTLASEWNTAHRHSGSADHRPNVAAGLEKAVRESGFTKPINVHTLRHCYGTHLLEEGASVRSVQDNLGHRSGRTTSTYVHQTAKRTRQSADAIERIAQNLPR